MNQFKREELKQAILNGIRCTDFLEKSKGGNYCCPFCDSGHKSNGTGAVKYYPETNTISCFADCAVNNGNIGKRYDVLDLIQKQYGCTFNEAMAIGAEILHIPYPEDDEKPYKAAGQVKRKPAATIKGGAQASDDTKKSDPDFTEYYARCEEMLMQSPEALSYLAKRGISPAVYKAHHIGFDPKADPADSNHPTPRIIIPVSTRHYIGRRIDGIKEYAKMNNAGVSPDITNASLLNGNSDIIFIVEGIFDCMSIVEMQQAAIAINSTSNVGKLLEYLPNTKCKAAFIICLDNDPDPQTKGTTRKAAERLQAGLTALGYRSMMADICGKYKDPNDALVNDRDGFGRMISDAMNSMREYMKQDYLSDFLDKIRTDAYKPYPTDLPFIDNLLNGGIVPQSLLLLMASPAAGKTTLCQQMVEQMAEHQKPVEYLNLEMSREQMLAKAIAGRINKNPQYNYHLTATDVMQGYKWTEQMQELIPAEIERYRQQIFPYLKYNSATGNDIDSIAEHLHSIGEKAKRFGEPAPAIVLDYLHLVRAGKEKLETADLIKKIVVVLKDYAVQYNTFVIGIVAINRISKDNITLESGRDSSNIEYTGDYVLALDYAERNERDINDILQDQERRMTLRVLKNRFGSAGNHVDVIFRPADGMFIDKTRFHSAPEPNPFSAGTERKKVRR